MKKIYYFLLLIFPILFSCEDKETEDVSWTTLAPHLELKGANPIVVIKGAEFVDPGIYAEIYTSTGDTTKDAEYEVLGSVNPEVPGTYKLTYEVKNTEGVSFYINRTVSVVDYTGYDVFEIPTGSYTGLWTDRDNRILGTGIQIQKLTTGIYSVSDLIAGLYDQYAGYGPDLRGPGILIIDENGNLRTELGYSDGFLADITTENITFDPETNTLSYIVTIEGSYGWSYNVALKLE
ncbi:BT_2262 family domain-containing protein [Thermophagus sp. OGC60D27]|uniref:BT_2262 family domain-containing protein n=1 Tax=Thermophagus sp. OGC60D27 TaxID=3458415 RepID=UPI00403825FC